jgi:hypothetical protein
MNREEFLSLPPALALRVLLETLLEVNPEIGNALKRKEVPSVPRSPKYDERVYRRGGFCWASELNLESLRFWHGRYLEGAAKGGEWAEKDQKRASKLEYWIKWREVEPSAAWCGERGREQVMAHAPSGKPVIHEGKPRGAKTENSEPVGEDDYGESLPSDVPF